MEEPKQVTGIHIKIEKFEGDHVPGDGKVPVEVVEFGDELDVEEKKDGTD